LPLTLLFKINNCWEKAKLIFILTSIWFHFYQAKQNLGPIQLSIVHMLGCLKQHQMFSMLHQADCRVQERHSELKIRWLTSQSAQYCQPLAPLCIYSFCCGMRRAYRRSTWKIYSHKNKHAYIFYGRKIGKKGKIRKRSKSHVPNILNNPNLIFLHVY